MQLWSHNDSRMMDAHLIHNVSVSTRHTGVISIETPWLLIKLTYKPVHMQHCHNTYTERKE